MPPELSSEARLFHWFKVRGIIPAMEEDLLKALPQKAIRFLHRGNSEMWRLWLLSTAVLQGAEQ